MCGGADGNVASRFSTTMYDVDANIHEVNVTGSGTE
jgi:hypothetical protein